MAGKFENKNKKRAKQKSRGLGAKVLLLVIALVLLAACLLWLAQNEILQLPSLTQPEQTTPGTQAPDDQVIQSVDLTIDLGEGLLLERVGPYTGMYVEDGTNELVSGVMMAVLTNNSGKDLEYAQIIVGEGDAAANFTVTALPDGMSAILLEKDRKMYESGAAYDRAAAETVAFFQQPLTTMEETLQIQGLDGALNVTNISQSDITGDIVICYKNADSMYLYGGIAYRVKIEGGLKAGEIRQVMTEHYSGEGSCVVYVNVVE